ncbi:MAG: hydroxyacid dehydrogenase, partial [Desulfofustis sp.]|nr:hydroxyacid dehydrogenase [Desulfofustis sp.]
MKVFLSHNPEDLDVYFKKAYEALAGMAEVVRNPKERDLTAEEVIEVAAGCQVVVCHRSTHGKKELFDSLAEMAVFIRPQVDISDVDVAAADANG